MNQWNNQFNGNTMNGGGALMTTESFGQTSQMMMQETSVTAIAEQAKAAVQARYVMAMQRPRNWDQVRVRMLSACKRPRFAETAIYRKPVAGTTIEGPSARFAEEALRCMNNLMTEVYSVYEDNEKIVLRVSATDLESNLTYTRDITIKKTVERRKVRGNQEVVQTRTNTNGQKVYIVKATDDELLNKVNALVSKTQRNLALMILPSDIKEDCIDQCYATMKDREAKDPAFERKRIVDAFNSIGITPDDLVDWLSHSIDKSTPAEINELRQMYAAISQGEARWSDYAKDDDKSEEKPVQTKTNEVKEKLLQRAQKGVEKKTELQPSPSEPVAPPISHDQSTLPLDEPETVENKEPELSLHEQWKQQVSGAVKNHTRAVVDKLHEKSGLPTDLAKGWDSDGKMFSIALWRLVDKHGLPDESTYQTFNTLISEELTNMQEQLRGS